MDSWGCVSIQGSHPSKDAVYEGVAFVHREGRTKGRTHVVKCFAKGLRNKPLTPFILRDDTLLLLLCNPDSCSSHRTAEEQDGARNHHFIFYVLSFIGVVDDSLLEPAGHSSQAKRKRGR